MPSDETVKWAGRRYDQRTMKLTGKVKEHAFMCDGKFVTKKIAGFLEDPAPAPRRQQEDDVMSGAAPGRPSLWVVHVVLAVVLSVPEGVKGQDQLRIQVAGAGLFPGDAHALIGYDGGTDIGGEDCGPGMECEVPNWTLLAGLYAGGGTSGLSAYAHIGVEHKLTDQLSLGGVAFGLAHPHQRGFALRFDAMDVGAIKAGYGWRDDEEDDDEEDDEDDDHHGLFLSVEIAFEFIRDWFR